MTFKRRFRRGSCCTRFSLPTLLLLLLAGIVASTRNAAADELNPPDNLLRPIAEPTWSVRTLDGAAGSVTPEGTRVRLDVTVAGTHPWDVFLQGDCPIQEGKTYRLRFLARAQPPRTLRVTAVIDQADFHSVGLDQTKALTTQWELETLTFTATKALAAHDALQFQIGDQAGQVWLSDASLTSAPLPVAAPADLLLQPQSGEIRLEGTLQACLPTQGRLVLLAARSADPEQPSVDIIPPRRKVILVDSRTVLRPTHGTPAALGNFHTGDSIIVVGRNQGHGKPLVARMITAK